MKLTALCLFSLALIIAFFSFTDKGKELYQSFNHSVQESPINKIESRIHEIALSAQEVTDEVSQKASALVEMGEEYTEEEEQRLREELERSEIEIDQEIQKLKKRR